jgi:uncharacterized membrane protein YcgQ (UPF0703/DUF1980 family)
MFVINFKLDFKKVLIVCIFLALIIATIIEFGTSNVSSIPSNNKTDTTYDFALDEKNFTEILKQVHENIDANLNKTVKLSGFVFKMPDFKENYFVCGRNTILKGENAVAGFLCQSDQAKTLNDNEWVEITGVIVKGEYNTAMPVVNVGTLKKITAPANTFVENSEPTT